MIYRILCLSTIFSQVACGPLAIQGKTDKQVLPENNLGRYGDVDYALEDPSCNSGSQSSQISESSIYRFEGGKVAKQSYSFSTVDQDETFQAQNVDETWYGYHQKVKCQQRSDGSLTCSESANVLQKPLPLKVCRQPADFGRETVEGVAVTSMASLEESFAYYRSLKDSDANLPTTRLLVLPKVEKEVLDAQGGFKETRYETDNLAYAHNFNGKPAFVIYRKGKLSQELGLWKDVNLWESRWVIGHEFGHHVFKMHTGFKNSLLSALLADVDPPIIAGSNVEPEAGLSLQSASAKQHWGAVNEGFSDLFGFYLDGAKPSHLDGLDCFQHSRDITSRVFADGTRKVIDNRVYSIFIGNLNDTTNGFSCSSPRFRDIHSIGAIIAYGVHQLLVRSVASTGEMTEYGNLLVRWADRLSIFTTSSTEAQDVTLASLLGELFAEVAQGDTLSAQQCGVLSEIFPALRSQILSTQGLTCQR